MQWPSTGKIYFQRLFRFLVLYIVGALVDIHPEKAFPRNASEYLDEWARDNKGWLRKFYPPGEDRVHFDLTRIFHKDRSEKDESAEDTVLRAEKYLQAYWQYVESSFQAKRWRFGAFILCSRSLVKYAG